MEFKNVPNNTKISVYDRVVRIDRAYSSTKGEFRKFYVESLLPYCKENNIIAIYLSDCQTKEDMWTRYGFSGRFRKGDRYQFIKYEGNKEMNDYCRYGLDCLYSGDNEYDSFKESFIRRFKDISNETVMDIWLYVNEIYLDMDSITMTYDLKFIIDTYSK